MSHKLCIDRLLDMFRRPVWIVPHPNQMVIYWKWKMGGKKKVGSESECMCSCHHVRWRKKKKIKKNKRETGRCQDAGAKGFGQLASDNSAFARMNSLRDYMAHADWTRDPFWPDGYFGGRVYPTLMEPLGSINWISRGIRQMDGWMAGRNVREIDGSLT